MKKSLNIQIFMSISTLLRDNLRKTANYETLPCIVPIWVDNTLPYTYVSREYLTLYLSQ